MLRTANPINSHQVDAIFAALGQADDRASALCRLPSGQLDAQLGTYISGIAPVKHALFVLVDHACSGLDPLPPRLHGSLPAGLQDTYRTLIVERDPFLARAAQDSRAICASIAEHCDWLLANARNSGAVQTWLNRVAQDGYLAVLPARSNLSRGALFAFFERAPSEETVFALHYAAQRLAAALEARSRPQLACLKSMRIVGRELDVLRAGLRGEADDEIAASVGLTVDAVRYYYKKFRASAPAVLEHLKPRELARILHQVGRL